MSDTQDLKKPADDQSRSNLGLGSVEWVEQTHCGGDDILYSAIGAWGRLTVLDRLTGWGGGCRDIESGYRDGGGKFWLASGGFDIRDYTELTIADAIALVKRSANTCIAA